MANVISAVSSKWYELGVELLDDHQLGQLDIIQINYDGVTRRCRAMLRCWLDTHCEATWDQLVTTLRSPAVSLNDVAATVEEQFTGMMSL